MGTAIVLDIENIGYTPKLEKFLKENASYKIIARIAVANFKLKNDQIAKELFKEGYLQINVPSSPNSADAQILIQATLLLKTHPDIKELIIVSNDHIFKHLKPALGVFGVEVKQLHKKVKQGKLNNSQNKTNKVKQSQSNFDKKLITILNNLCRNKQKINLTELRSEYSKNYGQSIEQEFKKLNSKIRLITYLKNHNLVIVQKNQSNYLLQLVK